MSDRSTPQQPTESVSADTPAPSDGPRSTRRTALLRAGLLVVVVVAAALALRHPSVQANLQEDRVIELLQQFRSHPLGIPALILGFVLLACLGTPVTFLMLTTGAVYGVFPGAGISIVSAVLSGVVTFGLAKTIGNDLNLDRFDQKLGPLRKRIERQLSRHGIWNLISFRFIPIPYAIANTFLALTGVKLAKFVVSTAIALVPTSVAWSYFAQSIVGANDASRAEAVRNIGIGLVALLALSLMPELVRRITRRRRYRELTEQRRAARGI